MALKAFKQYQYKEHLESSNRRFWNI